MAANVALAGGYWGPGEPPLNEPAESYRLEIWDGDILKRSLDLAAPAYLYSAALQTADFGALPSAIGLRVGQIGAGGLPGLMTEMTISL